MGVESLGNCFGDAAYQSIQMGWLHRLTQAQLYTTRFDSRKEFLSEKEDKKVKYKKFIRYEQTR